MSAMVLGHGFGDSADLGLGGKLNITFVILFLDLMFHVFPLLGRWYLDSEESADDCQGKKEGAVIEGGQDRDFLFATVLAGD